MRAVLLVVAARFRRGWRSWLLLSLLIALVSGVAMAAATAGRRAASAFPRFVAEHGFDVAVYSARPLPGLARLPEVRQVIPGALPLRRPVTCDCPRPLSQANLTVRILPGPGALGEVVKLVSGRMPSGPGEVLASYNLAEDGNVRIGTVLRTRLYAPSQRGRCWPPAASPAGTGRDIGDAPGDRHRGGGERIPVRPVRRRRTSTSARRSRPRTPACPRCRCTTCGSGTAPRTWAGSRAQNRRAARRRGAGPGPRRPPRSPRRSGRRPPAGGCLPGWPCWPGSRSPGRRWPGRRPSRTPTTRCWPRWACARRKLVGGEPGPFPGRGGRRCGGRGQPGGGAVAVHPGRRGPAGRPLRRTARRLAGAGRRGTAHGSGHRGARRAARAAQCSWPGPAPGPAGAGPGIPAVRNGACAGLGGCTARRDHRHPAGAAARPSSRAGFWCGAGRHRAGRHGAGRHGHGGRRAVRDRGVRRQPGAPDRVARAVRGAVPVVLRHERAGHRADREAGCSPSSAAIRRWRGSRWPGPRR